MSRPLPLLWLLLLALTSSVVALADSDHCGAEIVAAFDVGSGTTRMHVAALDPCANTPLRRLAGADVRIDFAADLAAAPGESFSDAHSARATQKIAGLVEQAHQEGAQILLGVATEAFRRAGNGQALLDQWREAFAIDIEIIDQAQEGRLAYGLVENIRPGPEPLLIWDIGAGSQQLVWQDPVGGRFRHLNSNLASVTFRDRAVERLGRPEGTVSPNPVAAEEVPILNVLIEEWIAAALPEDLPTLQGPGTRVVGLGGVHGASVTAQTGAAPGEMIAREQVADALSRQLGRDDAAIGGRYADTDVTNLILVYTLMGVYGIDRYLATRSDLGEAILARCLTSRRQAVSPPRAPDRLRSDCLDAGR